MKNKILQIMLRQLPNLEGITDYQRYVLYRVLQCRTEPVPFMVTHCDHCGKSHRVYKSCRNRLCPVCNGGSSVKWLAQREAELLPTAYFMLTFTVPSELRPWFLYNQVLAYNLLFKGVSKTLLQEIRKGFRSLQGEAGFFIMLHTWDQRLNYHPHLHVVIPAGCLNEDRTAWNPSGKNFFLPVQRLSILFRKKLLSYLKKEAEQMVIPTNMESSEDLSLLISSLSEKDWVVHCQAPSKKTKNPRTLIRYLARYVSNTAVKEERIERMENGKVYLNYVDRKKKIAKTEELSEELFLRRMLLHVLPVGFKKVRFYGFMANRYRKSRLILCRMLLGISLDEQEAVTMETPDTAFLFWKYFGVDIFLCRDCGKGHFRFTKSLNPDGG